MYGGALLAGTYSLIEIVMYGGASLARTYSLIEIVGTGKRSVAVHYPIFDDCNSLKANDQLTGGLLKLVVR
jgi:hypothetical protein